MFCERGQAELIRQVAAHVKERGRFIQRGKNRRYFAKQSALWLDYECASEGRVQYKKRDYGRYAAVPGYGSYVHKRDKVISYGEVERLRCEGWWAVLGLRVQIFGDLEKMTRDLTMLKLSSDLDV